MENRNQSNIFQVAEIKLSYSLKAKASQLPKVSTSAHACDLFRNSWDMDRIELVEQFKVMLLNRAQRVLGIMELSSGNATSTIADPKLIFAAALKANAISIILAHNHPSGSLAASQQDLDLTRKMREAGRLLDLPVLDHLIITNEGYFSFADEGLF